MDKNIGGDPALLAAGRAFLQDGGSMGREFESDQEKKLPMPPLTKAAGAGPVIPLTRDFEAVIRQRDFVALLEERVSHRNYLPEAIKLDQLAFLLWSAQGITQVLDSGYVAFRTYPSAGGRHPFELYITVHNVDGLEPGVYHYLADGHVLELVRPAPEDFKEQVSHTLYDQSWCKKAGAVFFFSTVPYRTEWRYSVGSHRVILMDSGHAMQNLYLACHAAGLGTCAIAALRHEACDSLLGLDGEEEFTLYAAPVGTVAPAARKRSLGPKAETQND